jgi:hypothetical protein
VNRHSILHARVADALGAVDRSPLLFPDMRVLMRSGVVPISARSLISRTRKSATSAQGSPRRPHG